MRSLQIYAAVALLTAVSVWLLAFKPRIDLIDTQLGYAWQQLDAARELDSERVSVIRAQAGQLAAVLENELKNRQLLAEIQTQGRAHSAALQELKRNDKKIMDYLDQPVPVGLGRLYQRPATTDPAAYRQQADVRADSVPAAGKAGLAGE